VNILVLEAVACIPRMGSRLLEVVERVL